MKNIIYITNQEVPYKVEFFNHLSKYCNLHVIYDKEIGSKRNKKWSKSIKNKFKYTYLCTDYKKRIFSVKLIKLLLKNKDSKVIFGCINSPIELTTILVMKLFKRKFAINLDGEYFFGKKSIKNFLKILILKNADHYFVAGEVAANNFKKMMNITNVSCYHFTSLSKEDLNRNRNKKNKLINNNKILVISRYHPIKGLDIALEVAKKTPNYHYIFVGSDNLYEKFKNKVLSMNLNNVEIIPFLQKKDLFEFYQNCELFLLPSLKECWGLVINEAASFGIPIISTYGSGAAVDFLSPSYKKYLARPGDVIDLYNKIVSIMNSKEKYVYSDFLLEKSKKYTIENIVEEHLRWINNDEKL